MNTTGAGCTNTECDAHLANVYLRTWNRRSPSVPTAAAPKLDPITDYWFAHYVNENMCSLCAQSGIIDTTAKRTPAGLEVGRRNFCICPNGQSLRARVQGENA